MSFISIEFIIFAFIVFPLYFLLPARRRWILLLIASYIFYAFSRASYIFLIAFSTWIDYWVARNLGNTPTEQRRKRKLLLLTSITVNLGVLFIFKYFNFFSSSIAFFTGQAPLSLDVILPVGISFYTFQSMAYTIDVYRGLVQPEKHFGIFATYIAFFPQLVAGPIERAPNLLPQFRKVFNFDYDRVVSGLRLVLWGAFKKVFIADRLAIYVNAVYNDLPSYGGLPLWVATFFFAFQIYCDFSGYSDIAIGLARIMGFDLMKNFDQPYFSQSISEFWRRWHISLSTWFRDYVYIPLGGNRVSLGRNLVNLFVVFVVSGLWHGANWTFVLWGAIHGVVVVVETAYRRLISKEQRLHIPALVRWALTFAIADFAWIFFRANSIQDAGYVLGKLFDFSQGGATLLKPVFDLALDPHIEFLLLGGSIVLLLGIEWLNRHIQLEAKVMRRPLVRWALYYAGALAVLFAFLNTLTAEPFIYFQF